MMPAGSILVADDDTAIRTVLNQALSRAGYEVRLTGNAATLWRWVSQGEGDLVITDVVMPGMSGPMLAKELLADEKERAEHLMLLDLGRNDVGRVAGTGTVQVTESFVIERYSYVMHLVSNVRGKLAAGRDCFDAFRATFPAGTLTGAPKIRAMEIIEELEPVRRGLYGGAVGYFAFSGAMDTAITIRTVLVKGGRVYIQAGAGIVADSDPEAEHRECVNKARAVVGAVEVARQASISGGS